MDISRIGAFITENRKAKGMTQKDLADKLCITDRAVSKWECGKGLPDVSIMTPLCEILGITLNELLSGEKIAKQDTASRAEKQIMDLLCERQENKKKIWLSAIIGLVGICVLLASGILAAYVIKDLLAKVLTILFGLIIMAVCFVVTIIVDKDAGSYECPNCKKRFVPDLKTYAKSLQVFGIKRKMICPHCGERKWCKRKLNK